jgi:hypothetical protein
VHGHSTLGGKLPEGVAMDAEVLGGSPGIQPLVYGLFRITGALHQAIDDKVCQAPEQCVDHSYVDCVSCGRSLRDGIKVANETL